MLSSTMVDCKEVYVIDGINEEEPAIIEADGKTWVRDPWEGALHSITVCFTTPGGVRIAEAYYTGALGADPERDTDTSAIHLVAIQLAER